MVAGKEKVSGVISMQKRMGIEETRKGKEGSDEFGWKRMGGQ